jgi:4-hydroxy-tetrahydrodipicolinate synthase
MFSGVMPALITPFHNGAVDEDALRQHIDWVITSGVHGIVPCGTTGEAGALTNDEYRRVVTIAVEEAKGRVPVIAGAGANATQKAIDLTQLCAGCKVDGLLHVTPYYNKPTQEGIRQHFTAIAQSTTLPIVLYNVPGRTGCNMSPDTTAALATINNIVALKDASGSVAQGSEHAVKSPKGFALLSGEDGINYPLYAIGHCGAISVTANVEPAKVSACWNAWKAGDSATAGRIHAELQPLNQAMFFESNPIPVKTALAMMGRCEEEWRLPLCAMAKETRERLAGVLRLCELTT